MPISQRPQQLGSTQFFTALTVIETQLKAVMVWEEWFVYSVSFDHLATVALNLRNCRQRVETERVPSICSCVQRDSERKYFGRIVNYKDYKVITSKLLKMNNIQIGDIYGHSSSIPTRNVITTSDE